jgi:hypothetical protein
MFKKLLDAMTEQVPTEASVPVANSAAPVANTTVTTSSPTASPTDNSKVDQVKAMLYEVLEKKPKAGVAFDYWKYKQALKSTESVILDEKVRFVTAYQTAKILKTSKAELVESAKYCLTVISQEEQNFQNTVKTQEDTLSSDKATIENLNKQIAALNKQVEDLVKEKSSLETKIGSTSQRISAAVSSYKTAVSTVTSEVQSDITKMTTYLEQ